MTNARGDIQRPLSLRFDRDGLAIHYMDWGEGSPRHLMLLHGLGSQAHAWDQFAKDACDSFRVVAPDLRGHGESGHANDGYALDRFAADVKALARHLNLPSFDLVGHSLGALIAIQFAAGNPHMVNHLVLVDLTQTGVTGKEAEESLEAAGIVCNRNAIPFDSRPPRIASGIRVGTPAATTRGLGQAEMKQIADWIVKVISNIASPEVRKQVKEEVMEMCRRFPIPGIE